MSDENLDRFGHVDLGFTGTVVVAMLAEWRFHDRFLRCRTFIALLASGDQLFSRADPSMIRTSSHRRSRVSGRRPACARDRHRSPRCPREKTRDGRRACGSQVPSGRYGVFRSRMGHAFWRALHQTFESTIIEPPLVGVTATSVVEDSPPRARRNTANPIATAPMPPATIDIKRSRSARS